MPYTVNGIGTSYYGKRNVTISNTVCPYCHKPAQLQSYETGYYFVVLFIPIIPLGRKQIIDQCSRCSRHRVISLKEWQVAKQNALAHSTEQLAQDVNDAKAALQHLGSLTAFGERDEARELAEAIAAQHADNAETQFLLGAWYEHAGDQATADLCFERAYCLDPKNARYARAKALCLMDQAQLDQSRQILRETMEPPSPNFDPSAYMRLATFYQQAGRDREALELFGLLKDQPGYQSNKAFRKAVSRSERRCGSSESMLNKPPMVRRRSFWLAALTTIFVAGFLGLNWFAGQRHQLHVVNGLGQSIKIEIDGGRPLAVPPESRTIATISEGPHVVRVLEPQGHNEPRAFVIATSFWNRFFSRPVLLLDPLRTCAVYWEETKYSETPNANDGSVDVRAAELLVRFPPVDYLFGEFPDSLQVDSKRREVTKTKIGFAPLEAEDLLSFAEIAPEEQLRIAENLVDLRPDSSHDLFGYYLIAKTNDAVPRFQEYLSKQMRLRPVRVRPHELYQETAPGEGITSAELEAEYDQLLLAEPNNPDLVYLRGRLEYSVAESNKYFEQAVASSKGHRAARIAIAANDLATGQYSAALPRLRELYNENQWDQSIQDMYASCLTAIRDFDAAIQIQHGKPGDTDAEAGTLRALKHAATVQELPVSERKGTARGLDAFVAKDSRVSEPISVAMRQFYLAYYKRDVAQMKTTADLLAGYGESGWFRFVAGLEAADAQGAEAAEKLAVAEPEMLSTGDLFMLAIALRLAGKTELAEHWWGEGLNDLRSAGRSDVRMAELIEQSRTDSVDLAELSDLRVPPNEKRIYLLAIRELGGDMRPELADLIRRFNFDVEFPYYLIRDRLAK